MFDRDAAREVLIKSDPWTLDDPPQFDESILDALAGCVRPVPPQTIDRKRVWPIIAESMGYESDSQSSNVAGVVDAILAFVVPDSRFDTIRALHEPEQHYTIDQKHRYIPTFQTCKNDKQRYPCATVRALDGES